MDSRALLNDLVQHQNHSQMVFFWSKLTSEPTKRASENDIQRANHNFLLGQWLNGLNFGGLHIFSRENRPFKLFVSGSIG